MKRKNAGERWLFANCIEEFRFKESPPMGHKKEASQHQITTVLEIMR
jgi:hypothetical protein